MPVSTLSTLNNTTTIAVARRPFNNFGTQSSIQYKKVALQLEVVPLINSEKEVTLDILQKLDSLGERHDNRSKSDPDHRDALYQDDCLGAERRDDCPGRIDHRYQADYDKSGIPVLSRIPLIGALFRQTSRAWRPKGAPYPDATRGCTDEARSLIASAKSTRRRRILVRRWIRTIAPIARSRGDGKQGRASRARSSGDEVTAVRHVEFARKNVSPG